MSIVLALLATLAACLVCVPVIYGYAIVVDTIREAIYQHRKARTNAIN